MAKFSQLPIGAEFLWQGKRYTKVSPLLGADADGQRIIPRSAVVETGERIAPPASAPGDLPAAAVHEALDGLCDGIGPMLADPADRQRLAQLRQAFLRRLGLAGPG